MRGKLFISMSVKRAPIFSDLEEAHTYIRYALMQFASVPFLLLLCWYGSQPQYKRELFFVGELCLFNMRYQKRT